MATRKKTGDRAGTRAAKSKKKSAKKKAVKKASSSKSGAKSAKSTKSTGKASSRQPAASAGTARESARASGENAASAPTVVVRKYENRRLYDTEASRYINLDRVAEMVRDGVDVQVVEVKSGRDVTRQVLTQIIVESSRAKEGPPLEFLRDLIRANDRARRDFFQWYLASATEVYHSVRDSFEAAARRSPGARLNALSKLWPTNPIGQALARALSLEEGESSRAPSRGERGERSTRDAESRAAASSRGRDARRSSEGDDDPLAELERLRARLERIERRFGAD